MVSESGKGSEFSIMLYKITRGRRTWNHEFAKQISQECEAFFFMPLRTFL